MVKFGSLTLVIIYDSFLINSFGKGAGPIGGTPEGSESLKFTGTVVNITDAFKSNGGSTIFELQYDGGSSFVVWLLNSNTSEKNSLLANKPRFFYGILAEVLGADYYKLEIEAEGDLFIKVSGNII